MRSASSENAPTQPSQRLDGADRAREKSYVQFMFLPRRSARSGELEVYCQKISIIPNNEKCETIRSSMVFVIGFLVFFALNGMSLV